MSFSKNTTKTFKRLPTSIVPVHYVLKLKPDLDSFTFFGEERIELNVLESTNRITLNSAQIEICKDEDESLVIFNDDKKILVESLEYDQENETVTLELKDCLRPGEAILSLKYTGILNDKMRGFYRSQYTGPDGVVRYSAVTQFQATDARRAFPCWDEPALKATFDISLIVPKDDKIKALSNMPISSESLNESDDLRVVQFSRTPIMSTYLVAFIVGEFDYCETRSKDNVLVRVYTPLGQSDQGRFAVDVAARALDFYKQYFQIAYPLEKMDLIAVADFALGAMENWGLVIYRGKYLLVDPEDTSTLSRQMVALVVAHELAHQWFGNLVTMEWWTHLWLNEGFAIFIEYLCVDHLFPEYNIWSQFVCDVFVPALALDGLQNSHPIEVPVDNPADVAEIFDAISYLKGASVIRMLKKYIGDEAFRTGLNQYLTKHSYGNTQTEDLWDSLEEASKKPVRRVMSTWTKQKGYPVISVSATLDPLTSSRVITLIQEKFNLNGKLSDEDRKALWAVPISIVSGSSSKQTNKPIMETLMENRTQRFTLTAGQLATDEWFKLNPSTVGVFRVRYSTELLNQFSSGIAHRTVPALDRLGLLNDLYALVLAGKQSPVDLFSFIQNGFREERDYTVWVTLVEIFDRFNQLLATTDYIDQFHQFGRDFINHSASQWIGWEPKSDEEKNSHLITLLRPLLLNCMVSFKDSKVLELCSKLFLDHCSGKKSIAADIRKAVYRGVACVAGSGVSTFESLIKLYRETLLEEEKNRIAAGLGNFSDAELLRNVLEFSLSNDVRSQDTVFVMQSVSINPLARDLCWSFFTSNHRLFSTRYEGGFLMSRLIRFITENFHTEKHAKDVSQFFSINHFAGTDLSVQQAIETIRLNSELLKRDSESIRNYLQSYTGKC